jgi:uncharacterized membrane protein YedE/YeeE
MLASQQHNRIIFRPPNGLGLWFHDGCRFGNRVRLAESEGAKVTIVTGALLTICTFITIERLSSLHQSIEQWDEAAATFGQFIFDPPR